jgi:hypothetical protein
MPRRACLAAALLLAACGGGDPDEPSLARLTGDGARGFAGNFTPDLPAVLVRDGSGAPRAGVEVTFSVTDGGGSLAVPVAVSDEDGRAEPGAWRFGAAGPQAVSATAPGYGTVTFAATAVAPTAGAFDIDLRFLDPQPTDGQRAAFLAARDRWAQIVLGDIPDFGGTIPAEPCGAEFSLPAVGTPVDDVVIFAGVQAIDGDGGILAQAGPCVIRGTGRLPIVGIVLFDTADLDLLTANASLTEVASHELAHALGFGTIWTDLGLLEGAGGSDPFFTGPGARQAFTALRAAGSPFAGNSVPVEGTGGPGTRDGHWRESVFDEELMTGFYDGGSSNPLSAVTIASLRDLGYVVDDTRGDPYSLGARLASVLAEGGAMMLRERLAPWPVIVVDEAGRPVSRHPPR